MQGTSGTRSIGNILAAKGPAGSAPKQRWKKHHSRHPEATPFLSVRFGWKADIAAFRARAHHGLMRFNVAARVLASYAAPLFLLLLLGGEGLWLATLLATASWPLLLLALAVSLAFASLVASRPVLWASAAVLVSLAAGFAVAGKAGFLLSGFVALPAAAIFLASLRKWPLRPTPH